MGNSHLPREISSYVDRRLSLEYYIKNYGLCVEIQMNKKNRRQAALLRIIELHPVTNQEELVQRLRADGFNATQSSISRDVRELGLVRLRGQYVPAKRLNADSAVVTSIYKNELITFSEPVGANLIVVKTPAGMASAVAVDLDKQRWPEIVGTVAGDDTIFVAVRSRAAQGQVLSRVRHA